MKLKLLAGLFAAQSILCPMAQAMEGDPYANETAAQKDARMAWWREARFGMFIHWGIYAVPAGVYEGKEIPGIGEWIMKNGKIPVATYQGYAKEFNPVNYDPKAWAALAKEAGMRYMVITSKHHDGFALFPTKASPWNVVDATPYQKDLIGPLAEAARAEGLKFGLYYSQAQDWVHPGGSKYGQKDRDGWDEAHKGVFADYINAIAVPQVREILTQYRPDVLWWDTPHLMTQPTAQKLAELLSLRPNIIHNNRLGGGYHGDTETPEQFIPATGFPNRDWETCMTMNDTWGFKSTDHQWKPLSKILTNLVDIASKGGNYLLNVGPDATGQIPQESITLLKQVGAWMKVNGEAIYGTHASPFKRLPWGRCTVKASENESTLYLHVLNWPASRKLLLPGLENEVVSSTLLANGAVLKTVKSEHGTIVESPANAPDPICSVIRLVVKGNLKLRAMPVLPDEYGVIRLTPIDANLKGRLKLGQRGGVDAIIAWDNPEDGVSWKLQAQHEGSYEVHLSAATRHTGSVIMVNGIAKLACSIPQTDDAKTFKTVKVGEVSLKKGQQVTLDLKPVVDGWNSISLQYVELVPQP